ncbi:MAG: hypothetical protein WBG18_23120 [Xanthobacteraceae bacterium]|jgi:hypothetical protein|nr:hypothetical protein [Xanthobacteraceae bacterium]
MTIFPLGLSRFSDLITVCFVRWKHHFAGAKLENLSDRALQDIGLEPCRRDFDTVKPFWMP